MSRTETYYNMGFRLNCPDVFDHPKGLVSPMAMGDRGDGIYFMMYTYIAASTEELKAIHSKSEGGEMSAEEGQKVLDAMASLAVVVGIGGNQKEKEIAEKLKMGEGSNDHFTEVGRYKDITYYVITSTDTDEAFMKAQPQYAEEFRALQEGLIEAMKNAEYFGPMIPGADQVGKTITFVTEDIDGNPVKSADLFAKHEVTMINIWATWCKPCRSELEELGKLHLRLKKKNAAIVGICDDAKEKKEECRALIAEKNLSYLNILPDEKMMDDLAVDSFPTSFFVNREGKIVTYPIIGVPADLSDYEKTIDSLLGGKTEVKEPAETNAAETRTDTCRVVIKDEAGSPVAGVRVQFCSDTACIMGKTDEEGIASFNAEKGQYTVHVQKVPEGYEPCDEEFAVNENLDDVTIILKKA